MRDWVRGGGQLPNDPQLADELMMPKLIFHGGVFRLEEKEQIKSRLGRSPDKADAFAQTFADVEQPSFFGDFSLPGGTKEMSYEELCRRFQDGEFEGRHNQGNYASEQSHIDKRFRPPSNYRS
jgi:hypothetical protein